MKQSRFSNSQIPAILKQVGAGKPVSEVCRENNISSVTFYKWRSKYGSMDASLMRARSRESASGKKTVIIQFLLAVPITIPCTLII